MMLPKAFWRHGRILTILLALASGIIVAAPRGQAQEPPSNPAASNLPAISPADIDALIKTLENPDTRATLVKQLETLKQAQQAAAPGPVRPDGLGAVLLATMSDQISQVSAALSQVFDILLDAPKLVDWVQAQATDSAARKAWAEFFSKLTGILILAWLLEFLTTRLLLRAHRALANHAHEGILWRIGAVLLRHLLELLPIVVFAAAAYSILPFTEPRRLTRLVILAFVNAHVAAQLVNAVTRLVLLPRGSTWRAFPMSDETATYLYIWIRRISVIAIYGYVSAEAALLLGLPVAAHGLYLRLVGLIIAAMLIVLILQNRTSLAQVIKGSRGGAVGLMRQRVAEVWHILAILYVVAIYAVWALGVAGGFQFLLRATIFTAIIFMAMRLAVLGVGRLVARGFALSEEIRERFPGLEARANRYLPLLRRTLNIILYSLTGFLLMEAWGIDSFRWLSSDVGRAITGSLLSIAFILAASILTEEVVSTFIERILRQSGSPGATARATRMHTLLPLLRNAFRLILVVVVALIVLSELGIDIAPLLAGAGVVGLAIGFGAQTLVKDVITGVFILLEDTISVGDIVQLDTHFGTVESLSIRSLRLRDTDGSVHTVPFSAVTVVRNYSKDYSYAVFDVTIAYDVDVDRAVEAILKAGAKTRKDPDYGLYILEPIEIQGLDRFGDSAVVIRARIKTRPGKQWIVTRGFNKHLKIIFDAEKIEIPFPHRTIYVRTTGDGKPAAPALGPVG